MYTSHPIPPRTPEGKLCFVTTQIKTWGLTGDADTFRQGASAFRNARDWAKEQRDNAIQQANERAKRVASFTASGLGLDLADEGSGEDTITTSQETVLRPHSHSHKSRPYDSDTSADELSSDLGHWLTAKRPRTSGSQSPRKKH